MPNPITDYKLPQSQTEVEKLASKIWAKNKFHMTYTQAYIKACRMLASVS